MCYPCTCADTRDYKCSDGVMIALKNKNMLAMNCTSQHKVLKNNSWTYCLARGEMLLVAKCSKANNHNIWAQKLSSVFFHFYIGIYIFIFGRHGSQGTCSKWHLWMILENM